MPTTKIRKKTPMKNRPCMWRRMAKKQSDGTRIGRLLRNTFAASMSNSKFLLPIHIKLFKNAGIDVATIDSTMNVIDNTHVMTKTNEGGMNANI